LSKLFFIKKLVVALSLLIVFSGCTPFVDNRGFNSELLDIKEIIVGSDTKDKVAEKFGSPSSTSLFPTEPGKGGSRWFYITKKTATTAFFKPETLKQQTIVIYFDPANVVTKVEKIDGEAKVDPNPNKTETTGYESNAMRDLFGNFGRYSGKKSSQSGNS
jgi:outer membrane protein assembly factor BamE (lipoprotein component of BamABCDE complex)